MRHLRTFESYSINEEEFFGIGKMISDFASPYMEKAKQVLKQIFEENPDLIEECDSMLATANISPADEKKATELLQSSPEEVEQAVEEVAPELVGERLRYNQYRKNRLIKESFFGKVGDVLGAILQWFGIGYAFYKLGVGLWTAIVGAGEAAIAAAASGAMIGLLVAMAIIVVGMILASGKSPWQLIGISHDKLPRGFKN